MMLILTVLTKLWKYNGRIYFYLFFLIITFLLTYNSFSQNLHIKNYKNLHSKTQISTAPIAASLLAALYIFNPIFNYEDRKFSVGITKEFSVGFGYFGEYRSGLEFTYNFKSSQRNSLRI